MKNVLVLSAVFIFLSVSAQRKVDPTDKIKISGKIKSEFIFSLTVLDSFPKKDIGDVTLTNQEGKIKATLKNLKGILIKDLFDKVEFPVDKPKELNEFYFIFEASDGYKAVFSWNEIFNTETGNGLYIVTEMNTLKMNEMDERILLISSKDFITGRRHIKGLEKIIVERINSDIK